MLVCLLSGMLLSSTVLGQTPEVKESRPYKSTVYDYLGFKDISSSEVNSNFIKPIYFDSVIPTQVLNLSNIDTSITNSRFSSQGVIKIAGVAGYPLIINDLNNNGKMDFVGSYKIGISSSLAEVAIFEQDSTSTFLLQKLYRDSLIYPLAVTDVDNDGLNELNIRRTPRYFDNYESVSIDSYPTEFRFSHNMWTGGGGAVGSETFTDLDQDGFVEVIYLGDNTLCQEPLTFVAEYSPSQLGFQRIYEHCLSTGFTYDYSIGDFDNDGALEFAAGTNHGEVHVIENISNDHYGVSFSDTLFAVNANMSVATNDLDQNGKAEFFIASDGFYNGSPGLRLYWYEASDNNAYSKVRSLFLPGISGLGTSALTSADLTGNGFEELILSLEGLVLVLTWESSNQFNVFYINWWTQSGQRIESITAYDTNFDSKTDLLVSVVDVQTSPLLKSYVLQQETISSVVPNETRFISSFKLYQNYPNPFNPTTRIDFKVERPGVYTLKIFGVNGRLIKTLWKRFSAIGLHSIEWDGTNETGSHIASGIYFYRLFSEDNSQLKKMMLLR